MDILIKYFWNIAKTIKTVIPQANILFKKIQQEILYP